MHIGYVPVVLLFALTLPVTAQEVDSLAVFTLEEVVINESGNTADSKSSLPVDVADKHFLQEHFTGNLMQTLQHIPGVHSMNIGSGFSKPMIRGMGFNRISVTENGVKQEGQQWGADHGLEIDAFNTEWVTILKGPSSLLYGGDAMGGVIEIKPLTAPFEDQLFGEVNLLAKSVNETLGGSLMLGVKKGAWHTKFRFSEQHFGDYHVPTDTIVYLTQRLPVHGQRLKNTAGVERNVALFTEYHKGHYSSNYTISNVSQKTGFFSGAHGIPNALRVEDDGDSRNIDLPYSTVNHLKISTNQQYGWNKWITYWNAGFQQNDREEWSLFHTHYGKNQPIPENDPDKELAFSLKTYNSLFKAKWIQSDIVEHTVGWDTQYQENTIAGYSFLLPQYNRFTTGIFWFGSYRPTPKILVSGGIRWDYGNINSSSYRDIHLEAYLQEQNEKPELIEKYKWRSYAVKRNFSNLSTSIGFVWNLNKRETVKANAGRSFRLPSVNELASNGVHHGTFRHEQGDSSLSSEQGWQVDFSYSYKKERLLLSITPFGSWFNNYIYLRPTGEWSILPHAGQIYRYTAIEALFAGTEISLGIDFFASFNYSISGEYVYTNNLDKHIPLAFSPPASVRNRIKWSHKQVQIYSELQSIAPQHRVANNEDKTPGTNLLHLGGMITIPFYKTKIEVNLSCQNILDTKYYNHLSFYRKVEIPEPGRNIQLFIKIPFLSKL